MKKNLLLMAVALCALAGVAVAAAPDPQGQATVLDASAVTRMNAMPDLTVSVEAATAIQVLKAVQVAIAPRAVTGEAVGAGSGDVVSAAGMPPTSPRERMRTPTQVLTAARDLAPVFMATSAAPAWRPSS